MYYRHYYYHRYQQHLFFLLLSLLTTLILLLLLIPPNVVVGSQKTRRNVANDGRRRGGGGLIITTPSGNIHQLFITTHSSLLVASSKRRTSTKEVPPPVGATAPAASSTRQKSHRHRHYSPSHSTCSFVLPSQLHHRLSSWATTTSCSTPHRYHRLCRFVHHNHPEVVLVRSSTQCRMTLIPMSTIDIERLISVRGVPTGEQYATYWGRTQTERYGRLLESAIVSFLGVFFSYFLSFVLGGFIATILGCTFVFWGILSPELKAYQRNWEFLSGRPLVDISETTIQSSSSSSFLGSNGNNIDPERAGLYGALFVGSIADVCVVEESTSKMEYDLNEFQDYRMEMDELDKYTGQPYLLRVNCCDKNGRELQIHARLSEEYLLLCSGMSLVGLLLSTNPTFTILSAITDLYVPEAKCWIGDYPYLNRPEMEALLQEDEVLWSNLLDERNI